MVVLVMGLAVFLVVRSRDDGPTAAEPAATAAPTLDVKPLTPRTALRPTGATLVLVPAEAEYLTITDLDAIRARLGVPDLTSEDLMTDRQAFWDRAEREAVLLTDGLLRADNSELWLDYDFSEDDVDWESRFSGPDGDPAGGGYVLAFRPDRDMAKVQAAVDAGVGPLVGATVWPELHLLTKGVADEGEPVWAGNPDLVGLLRGPGESTYLRRGCIPFADALGTDGGVEDQDAVLAQHDIAGLDDLPAVAVSFSDDVATAWFGPDREDLFDRADLIADWPTTGSIGFADGFAEDDAVDPSTGRIGLHVTNPVAAAHLTLTEILPFGVCNDASPLDEPTGL
ncbi:MAG: hypothetical protein ABIO16_15490 [Nocardioides sp.]